MYHFIGSILYNLIQARLEVLGFMKKLSCANLGKPECHFVAEGETAEEVKGKMMAHAKEMHPDVLDSMSEEEMMKMMDDKMM